MTQFRTIGLKLFSGAGHHGDDHDIAGIQILALGVVGLDHRAGHFVRRLAGAQVRQEFRIVMLAELDPAGRAAGDHGQHAAVSHTVDQLVRFFHNGQVSAEIGVEDLRKAQTAQRGGHLAGNAGADRHAEFFTQRSAHGGSRLHDHMLGAVGQRVPNVRDSVLLGQSAHGAGCDALSAVDAGHLTQLHVEGAFDGGLKAAHHRSDHAHLLHIGAGAHAAAAQDALVVVADDAVGAAVHFVFIASTGEAFAVLHAQFLA